MNKKTLIKKLKLSEADFAEIRNAVAEAEKSTDGEIALAVTAESSSYAFWELLTSLGAALLLVCCIFPFSPQIYSFLKNFIWNIQPWHLLTAYFVIAAFFVLVLYFLFQIPAVDSAIIPEAAKNKSVTNRSLRYFTESNVYSTKNHSGILIFVSYFEKQVRIVADKGISEKISQDLWNLIADEMTENFSKKQIKSAFLGAIKKCGDLLRENFPAQKENPNELNDGLVILEDERWV